MNIRIGGGGGGGVPGHVSFMIGGGGGGGGGARLHQLYNYEPWPPPPPQYLCHCVGTFLGFQQGPYCTFWARCKMRVGQGPDTRSAELEGQASNGEGGNRPIPLMPPLATY